MHRDGQVEDKVNGDHEEGGEDGGNQQSSGHTHAQTNVAVQVEAFTYICIYIHKRKYVYLQVVKMPVVTTSYAKKDEFDAHTYTYIYLYIYTNPSIYLKWKSSSLDAVCSFLMKSVFSNGFDEAPASFDEEDATISRVCR